MLCCNFVVVVVVVVVSVGPLCARPYSQGRSDRGGCGFGGLGLRRREVHGVQESGALICIGKVEFELCLDS